jgi:hypothetical protein
MFALFALAACLTPVQKDGGGDSADGDSGGGGGGNSIFDVREGRIADGQSVTITGALVSSPPTRADKESGRSDGFFIQDPAGGERSGLYVWSQGQFGSELALALGDEVTVSGKVSEYYGWTELVVGDASAITITGAGTLPAPADLGDGAGVDWDGWESVPVTLRDQTVESIDAYNTGMLTAGIGIDDGFVYNDYDCRGHYESVTGVIFYTYEAWSINNRTEADLGAYSEGEVVDTTVQAVRAGEVCGRVRLAGLVSSAPSFGEDDGRTYVFAQDPAGGPNSGIMLFTPAGFTAHAEGTEFEAVGSVSNYFGLAQIYVGDNGTLTATGTGVAQPTVVPAGVTDWYPYQSTLVTLENVVSTSDIDAHGAVLTDAGVYIDNLFYDFAAENGTTWASVTGPLYYTNYDDVPEFLVEPRGAADLQE